MSQTGCTENVVLRLEHQLFFNLLSPPESSPSWSYPLPHNGMSDSPIPFAPVVTNFLGQQLAFWLGIGFSHLSRLFSPSGWISRSNACSMQSGELRQMSN